ncbi:MFS transporter [Aeromicrobium sp. Leaf350]|uniref:MFS transporter n=1 Tax=Aeromicrobium sp. Leaf350 TaxID=2876565 RepID=UPI001E3C4B15|nr:MFS transporter [Aeromicrobium sp. Leaf350]
MSRPAGLTATSLLLLVTMLASFTPTPLYPAYREEWDLGDAQISWIFAGYPLGVMVVLVALGGMSDRIGRIPTLRVGAGLLIAALAVLASAPNLEALVAGRLLQGAATGLVTGAGAAALMDLHPRGSGAGTSRTTLMLATGLAIGPLLAGQATAHLPGPLVAPYAVTILLLLVPFAGLVAASATRPERTTAARLIAPIRVPRPILAPVALAAASVATTNVTFAMLGSYGPDVVARVASSSSPTVAGAFVSSILVLVALVQVLARGSRTVLMAAGATATAAGWGAVTVAAVLREPAVLVASVPLIGIGAGLGLHASAGHVGAVSPPERRAEIYSAYLLSAFVALALGAFGLGAVVDTAGITAAAGTAAGVCALLAVGTALGLGRPRQR